MLTRGEINAFYRLVENNIIVMDITEEIQQMAMYGNYEITANTAKGGEGRQIATLSSKDDTCTTLTRI